ncbi:hypothetical protein [Paraburkholderia mimosarum]|uniref:hypothetical protein n=1 Tax=Paraburkholderia mimosarum TaxID=312026 RepID=UPI000481610A|nr:hypothetical protein [Paraburkholderia mimosarum]
MVCHKEDDCRVALASTLNGMALGVLRAAPPWNMSPHSLSLRAAICQACARGHFVIPAGADAIDVFMRYVESQAHNRLPVHPGYLEARRILAAGVDSSIGAAMLDAAMSLAEEGRTSSDRGKGVAQERTSRLAQSDAAHQPKPPAGSSLPPRRMAQSR